MLQKNPGVRHLRINIKDLIINKRFRQDLGNIDEFANSIKKFGLIQPIIITKKKELVCGRRRVEAHKKLGFSTIEAIIIDIDPNNLSQTEAEENIRRKNFTVKEMAEIDEFLREREEQAAKQRQRAAGFVNGSMQPVSENFAKGNKKGRSSAIIAKILGISDRTLEKIRYVKAAATTDPILYEKFWDKANRTNKIDKSYNKIKQISMIEEAKKSVLAKAPARTNRSLLDLKLGDMIKIGKEIKDNSIDLIFTDPPYTKDLLYLSDELATLAQRCLKPGASLVVISPNSGESFEYYFDTIRKFGLKFYNYKALLHDGDTARLDYYRIWADHKPLLWFFKSRSDDNNNLPTMYLDVHNTVHSRAPSKMLHEWEQSIVEAKYMINALTVEGMTVLDPFMGSGTTGKAAISQKRNFIGVEIDEVYFMVAQAQLS